MKTEVWTAEMHSFFLSSSCQAMKTTLLQDIDIVSILQLLAPSHYESQLGIQLCLVFIIQATSSSESVLNASGWAPLQVVHLYS